MGLASEWPSFSGESATNRDAGAGGSLESVVPLTGGTEGSNPLPSSEESANFRSLEVDGSGDVAKVFRRRSGRRVPQTRRPQYRSRGWVRDRAGRRGPTPRGVAQ